VPTPPATAEAPPADDALTLSSLLREARRQQRLSQLALSLELGVSTRHLGFVEVGRSRPGRDLLVRWLDRLQVPFATRNEALRLAGYAPAYDESPLSAALLADARRALVHLVRSHEPWPAVVLDADWRIVAGNHGFHRLARLTGSTLELPSLDADGRPGGPGPTLLDLVLAPGGMGGALVNLLEVAPAVLGQLRRESLTNPRLRPLVEQLAPLVPDDAPPVLFPPTLVTRYATDLGELAFLSMVTTFGTPQSISLASLRVELMFPADDATRQAVATS
jgi:transcriptional regulator with XRE-family HTH domain